jgi:signal transduction histidine kinase
LSPCNEILPLDGKSLNSEAIRISQALLVNDVSQDERYLADEQLPLTHAELVIPLHVGENAIGTLDVHADRVNAFRGDDLLVIQSLGDQIAIAIENLRLYEANRELAVLEERNRLARELHDSVTQSLYSLSLMAAGLRKLMQSGEMGSLDRRLEIMGESTQQALQEMRLLIHELRPPALEQEGLVGALRQRLDAVENRAGVQARLLVDDFVELPKDVEEGLYRIAQEALNNALKHAEASLVDVHLFTAAQAYVLEVRDNGVGFDVKSVSQGAGMGLVNMRERAQSLGADFHINSTVGEGTVVQVRSPLPRLRRRNEQD